MWRMFRIAEREPTRRSESNAKRLASVVLLLFTLHPGNAGSADREARSPEDDIAAAVPGMISSVATGPVGSSRGPNRLVVVSAGDDHLYSKTYAQWLYPSADGGSKISRSVPIPELTDQPLFVVRNIRFVSSTSPSGGVFEVELMNRYTEKTGIARVRTGSPDQVSIAMPPNEAAE